MSTTQRYTSGEEIANSLTHGIGAGLSIIAMAVLVILSIQAGDPWQMVSFGIYGLCLVLLYLSSTLYHALRSLRAKQVFRIFDHIAIYLLIAGTYTPVALVSLRSGWGWTLFCVIWACAIAGIVLEVFFPGRLGWLKMTTYIGMGWVAVIAIKPLIEALPIGAIIWFLVGGLFYTFGVTFYLWRKLPYNHAIWHLFVLSGSICHFCAFIFYIIP